MDPLNHARHNSQCSTESECQHDLTNSNGTAVVSNEKVTLKRRLGLFSGVCFIVTTILGKL